MENAQIATLLATQIQYFEGRLKVRDELTMADVSPLPDPVDGKVRLAAAKFMMTDNTTQSALFFLRNLKKRLEATG